MDKNVLQHLQSDLKLQSIGFVSKKFGRRKMVVNSSSAAWN